MVWNWFVYGSWELWKPQRNCTFMNSASDLHQFSSRKANRIKDDARSEKGLIQKWQADNAKRQQTKGETTDGRRMTHPTVRCICRGISSQEQQGVFSSTPRDVISIDFHYILVWSEILLFYTPTELFTVCWKPKSSIIFYCDMKKSPEYFFLCGSLL